MTSAADRALGRLATGLDTVDRLIDEEGRKLVATVGLLLTFVLVTVERLLGAYRLDTFAIDLRIYRSAADAALHGADPWAAGVGGLTFAGPPPTLLPYLPAALVPQELAIAVYGVVTVAAAVVAVRAVGLPLWWLLFPPIVDCLIVLNPDVVVVALLLAAPRLAGLAVVIKVYGAVPLALTGRWRALAAGIGLCLLSIPWWPAFFAAAPTIEAALATQSFGGMSAWGTWLMVPTVLALIALWRRGAEWLTVPALWPYTQLHYSTLALPVAARSAMVAFLLCFPVAFLPAIATIYFALSVVIGERVATYRSGATKIEPSVSV
jgi:hypothetical protein